MVTLTINDITVEVEAETTILQAATEMGVEIPTMCYLNDYPKHTSCMICLVEEKGKNNMLPACSTIATDGMQIATNSEEVLAMRKDALELLLSDHVGDCVAPCQVVCPAYMDIPKMNRLIADGKFTEALINVKDDIALPGVLGYICPKPCENVCRRRQYDSAVSICVLKRFVAIHNIDSKDKYLPKIAPQNNKKVAIVGAGPTGLGAAYYLLQMGYTCTLFDKNSQAGGMLRYGALKNNLPEEILNQEIDIIASMGAEFKMNTNIDYNTIEQWIAADYDAVIVASGEMQNLDYENINLNKNKSGIIVDPITLATSAKGIFAGGNAVRKQRMAVRAVGHGKTMAHSVHQYLSDKPITGIPKVFNSKFSKLFDSEVEEYLKEANTAQRIQVDNSLRTGYTKEDAINEAQRCMHCDCREGDNCKLRIYADQYKASQRTFKQAERKSIVKNSSHHQIIYEAEKCIKCGICVRICQQHSEEFGMTYIGRGFDIQINIPHTTTMDKALAKTALLCAENCPTGALASK